ADPAEQRRSPAREHGVLLLDARVHQRGAHVGREVPQRAVEALVEREADHRHPLGGRRDGPLGFIEDRVRTFGLVYRLTVSGSF
ncbi:MAG: hypothetical protein AAF067_10405, partial [Pseudomonadota bacterium]